MASPDAIRMPYEYYEGQEPNLGQAVGGWGQNIGGGMVSNYVGNALFGAGAGAAASGLGGVGAGIAAAPAAAAAGASAAGAGLATGAGAATAAGLGAAMPFLGAGIFILGALLSAGSSKPKKKKGYQMVPVAKVAPVPMPSMPSMSLQSNYGQQLPPGFRV